MSDKYTNYHGINGFPSAPFPKYLSSPLYHFLSFSEYFYHCHPLPPLWLFLELTRMRYTFIPWNASCVTYKVVLIMVSSFIYLVLQISLLIFMPTEGLSYDLSFHIWELYVYGDNHNSCSSKCSVLFLYLVSKLNTIGW